MGCICLFLQENGCNILCNFVFTLTSSWIKGWFLGLSNLEHPTCKRLFPSSSFITLTVWPQAEISWDRRPVLCLTHWYRYSLHRGKNSRNILTLDVHFLNTFVTSCWWHIWCRWMTVFDVGGSFCDRGSLKNGKQKNWYQHHYLCTQRTYRAWLVTNFLKFDSRVVGKTILNSKGFFSFFHAFLVKFLCRRVF